MTAEIAAVSDKKPRGRTARRPRGLYPYHDLAMSVDVARAIYERAGGRTDRPHLASFLDYKSAKTGGFNARLASARLFGVIEGGGNDLSPSALAQRILTPTYEEQAREGLILAFFNVPLFRAVYEQFEGQELPPEFGMQNYLRTQCDVPGDQVSVVYRLLMDSADQAGFFEARGRTHMIKPIIRPSEGAAAELDKPDEDQGGGDEPPPPPPRVADPSEVRMEYVRKLISRIGEEGEDEEALRQRIERLLESGGGN